MRGPLVYCVEATDNGDGLNGIELAGNLSDAKTAELPELRGAVAPRSAGHTRRSRLGSHALPNLAAEDQEDNGAVRAVSFLG
ncbi:hypothetical protein LP421_02410 (plasmid) [Rhizobium sp. RCAM05350]|nr:hypothetical protein LP421_02410 [Rhizobium sp. RCAM05350]